MSTALGEEHFVLLGDLHDSSDVLDGVGQDGTEFRRAVG